MRLEYEPCPCGRTMPRISRLKGRAAHMIKVGDARIFPIDIEEVIHTISQLTGEYQILLEKPGVQDRLKISAECHSEVSEREPLGKMLADELRKNIGVESKVELLAYGEFSRGPQMKAQRIVRDY